MLPSILLIPRPFIDFMAASEPCAARSGFLDMVIGYPYLPVNRRQATRGCLNVTV
jgi:hypothetical protein